MLCTRRAGVPKTPYNLGKFAYPCCVVSILYCMTAVVLIMIPSVSPITASNMNYSILIFFVSLLAMLVAWLAGARKSYRAPVLEFIVGSVSTIDGKNGHENENQSQHENDADALGKPNPTTIALGEQ
ncbi:hypothetical protein A1O3_09341 [Capronia epimyces CBS 606.96]|uniref:Uncharacterized protein n=1 Tax=Capronia epimyces CBS 606.96 TaxID=1182542 RepID=W9XLH0_9EURO|nr:uncharacterized protein A1O3_09341 [Capronia epimyces CBS 606.96]EXJ78180.1 hypothetical protein A1O3_09341 [Capronia epimyces CBS 606.96]